MNAQEHFSKIKETWKYLYQIPGIFAYNLNVTQKKYLPANYKFYIELNPERSSLRRAPQQITSLTPTFDESKFNFKKINPDERMLDIPFVDSVVSMIINRSPLTEFHTLICPDLNACHPQIITKKSLHFCVDFLLQLKNARSIRIGYNSPGALASVNHLHLHLLNIDTDLYIDNADLEPLANEYIYRLSSKIPMEAICFIINKNDDIPTKDIKLKKLFAFLQWLCAENFPHNIFMTPSRESNSTIESLKIFVFAREKACIIKDVTALNIGFCELSGYIAVGSTKVYENLTVEEVILKIITETGNAFSKIYCYF